MDRIFGKLKNIQAMVLVFTSVFLLSFHYFFVYFINSTYLSTYFGEQSLGYFFTAGAILNIAVFLYAPRFLKKNGNYKLTIYLTMLELAALIGLAAIPNAFVAVALFILHQAVGPTLFYCMDIFIERYADSKEMGSIRGMYLTIQNIPPIVTPFISGIILVKPEYWKIYMIGAALLIPFLIVIALNFKQFADQEYPVLRLKEAAKKFYADKNVFDVFVDHFLLHLFYGWTVIYMPIYLNQYIGFGWSEIGIIFSVMLLPFILFQIPIGRMEDKYNDEKNILVIGFCIMAASFMLIPFISEKSIVLWAAILFISRIGASFVEVSSESFFFKHVCPSNAGFISFFRMTRALPYLISPAIVGITLYFFEFKYIFFVAGLLMFIGVRYALLLDNAEKKDIC
ncbi:MAG TPA: MFS transporter [Candidatus Paceibacterota bacterium]